MVRSDPDRPTPATGVTAVDAQTPPDLIFPSQYPFSWTLRGARARRLRANTTPTIIRYRIVGSAHRREEIAAAVAYCEAHHAKLELA